MSKAQFGFGCTSDWLRKWRQCFNEVSYMYSPYPNCELANQKPCLLSWFSAITRHCPDILQYHGQFLKLALFVDLRNENYNRNTAKQTTNTFVTRESNLFNAIREKNTISGQNWTPLHWQALACTFTDSAETFLFQNEAGFSKFLS